MSNLRGKDSQYIHSYESRTAYEKKAKEFKNYKQDGFTRKEALKEIHPDSTAWQRPMKAGHGKPLRKVEETTTGQPNQTASSGGGSCLILLIIFFFSSVATTLAVIVWS